MTTNLNASLNNEYLSINDFINETKIKQTKSVSQINEDKFVSPIAIKNESRKISEPEKKKTFLDEFRLWLNSPSKSYTQNNDRAKKVHTNADTLKSVFVSAIFFAAYFAMLSKVMKGRGFNFELMGGRKQKLSYSFENIDNAQSLSELALSDKLLEAANNFFYKISNEKEYIEKGGTGKNSLLLYGPAGSGKTTFAKAIAKSCPNSVFTSIDFSQIESSYIGESEKNLSNIAKKITNFAKDNPDKKVFVLLDEIDSFALEDNGSHNQQYHAKLLNTLKKVISEDFMQQKNIVTIATTNVDINPEKEIESSRKRLSKPILDRFNEIIKIENPTASQFKRAIAAHYKKSANVQACLKNEKSAEVAKIADKLEQNKYSFRTLESLYDIAASINKKTSVLTYDDVMAAIDKIAAQKDKVSPARIGFRI